MGVSLLALVGVTGGAGTTRLTVEIAATLARTGRSVAVVDAAYATQGLSTYVPARIDHDLTAVVTGEAAVEDARYSLDLDIDGRVDCWPAAAPFERIARAKTPESAQELERVIGDATNRADHVLLDVPPIAANQAVAAVTSVRHRTLVVPATRRGADLLPRQQGRLRDLDVPATSIVATRTDADRAISLDDADHAIPGADHTVTQPACLDPDATFAPAIADATEALLDVDLGLTFEDGGLF